MMNELTKKLRLFVAERDWQQFHDPKNLSMLLASEVGELVAELRWVRNEEADSKLKEVGLREKVVEEIGDVVIAAFLLADRIGVDPIEAALCKLEKNKKKYPRDLAKGKAERPKLFEG